MEQGDRATKFQAVERQYTESGELFIKEFNGRVDQEISDLDLKASQFLDTLSELKQNAENVVSAIGVSRSRPSIVVKNARLVHATFNCPR